MQKNNQVIITGNVASGKTTLSQQILSLDSINGIRRVFPIRYTYSKYYYCKLHLADKVAYKEYLQSQLLPIDQEVYYDKPKHFNEHHDLQEFLDETSRVFDKYYYDINESVFREVEVGLETNDTLQNGDIIVMPSDNLNKQLETNESVFVCVKIGSLTGADLELLYFLSRCKDFYIVGTMLDLIPPNELESIKEQWIEFFIKYNIFQDYQIASLRICFVSAYLYHMATSTQLCECQSDNYQRFCEENKLLPQDNNEIISKSGINDVGSVIINILKEKNNV